MDKDNKSNNCVSTAQGQGLSGLPNGVKSRLPVHHVSQGEGDSPQPTAFSHYSLREKNKSVAQVVSFAGFLF